MHGVGVSIAEDQASVEDLGDGRFKVTITLDVVTSGGAFLEKLKETFPSAEFDEQPTKITVIVAPPQHILLYGCDVADITTVFSKIEYVDGYTIAPAFANLPHPCISGDWCGCEAGALTLSANELATLNCDMNALDTSVPTQTSALELLRSSCLNQEAAESPPTCLDEPWLPDLLRRKFLESCLALWLTGRGSASGCDCLQNIGFLSGDEKLVFECQMWDLSLGQPIPAVLTDDFTITGPTSLSDMYTRMCNNEGGINQYREQLENLQEGRNDPVNTAISA